MNHPAALLVAALALASAAGAVEPLPGLEVPAEVEQGGLVFGHAPPGSVLMFGTRKVRVAADGSFVVGVGRDDTGSLQLHARAVDGRAVDAVVAIRPRQFAVERVDGVPEATVNPPAELAARIEREQAEVNHARERDDARQDYRFGFAWPARGRISGRYGSQRILNGTPKNPHYGVDIAATTGTPIKAPAGGVVSFARPDLYLTGGTVVVDHGHGLSSVFVHLSKLDVAAGDRIEQGEVLGRVGATGRATGPHLHWGMNWFDVRVDPELLVGPMPRPVGAPPGANGTTATSIAARAAPTR